MGRAGYAAARCAGADARAAVTGEHKLIAFIRACKSAEGYDPNMRHCMVGLDADLIMLALVSHEPHFSLLREEIDFTAFMQVRAVPGGLRAAHCRSPRCRRAARAHAE